MGESTKRMFKQGFQNVWRLFWSPFVGALDETNAAWSRPPAPNWKQAMCDALRAYFAPLTGAVRGFVRAAREILNQ